MQNLTMGIENVIATNGATISLVGIVIVFSALSVIALFIALLPKILPLTAWLLPIEEHPHGAPTASQSADHDEILAAIASALFHKQAASLPAK